MRSIFRMPSDDVAGDALGGAPVPYYRFIIIFRRGNDVIFRCRICTGIYPHGR